MTINIITDNNYFFLGIHAYLKNRHQAIRQLDPTKIKGMPKKSFDKEDITLFYTSRYSVDLSFLISTEFFLGKLIFIPTNNKIKFNVAFKNHVFLESNAGIKEISAIISQPTNAAPVSIKRHKDLLTDREKTILLHTIEGMNAHSISQHLCISIKTVYSHRRKAIQKLGGRNIFEIWPIKETIINSMVY
ncbi:helix-turn-helix domain-containing protein [Serratia fonticola]|uniref:helix-turn-helix domain-containing protein n=1 Tax=Serratia fonticola TaxID=47917 RepID=UPI001C468CC0|nr:helix-turn-helix transcriptional regulator [Serratia fonticola]QXN65169.1 helix-turn-helix transcriptional regulator [Serratia fonticola]